LLLRFIAETIFKSSQKASAQKADQRYRIWHDALVRVMREAYPQTPYRIIESRQMVGLFTCVFVKESEMLRIREISLVTVKTGLGGHYGNKVNINILFFFFAVAFFHCYFNLE